MSKKPPEPAEEDKSESYKWFEHGDDYSDKVALESLRELYDEKMAADKKADTEAEPEADEDAGDGGDDDGKKNVAAGDDDDKKVERADLSDDDNEMLDAVWEEIGKRKKG